MRIKAYLLFELQGFQVYTDCSNSETTVVPNRHSTPFSLHVTWSVSCSLSQSELSENRLLNTPVLPLLPAGVSSLCFQCHMLIMSCLLGASLKTNKVGSFFWRFCTFSTDAHIPAKPAAFLQRLKLQCRVLSSGNHFGVAVKPTWKVNFSPYFF